MFSANVFGQINNLVPNGDFEEIDSCFKQLESLWKVNNWNAALPNQFCSSEYFNKCQLSQNWQPKAPVYNVKKNGCAAIVLKSSRANYREYEQSNLTSSLQRDTNYIIEVSIRPIYWAYQSEWGVKQFEILFSNYMINSTIVNGSSLQRIDTFPSLKFNGSYLDTNIWYTCKSSYKAVGGENYLTIGIFSPDSVYAFYPIGDVLRQQWKEAYYLIDDVMVYKASDTIVRKQPEPILPNVFSPNQDGVNEVYAIQNLPPNSTLEVFNRWGGLVFTQAPYQNNWPGNAPNGQPLADGVYFAILTYQDAQGLVQQKKQTVHVVR
jgi:gliding motility-associated-like protein